MALNQPSAVTPTGIAVALAIVVALGFLFFGQSLFAPFEGSAQPTTEETLGEAPVLPTNSNELMSTDTVVGTGAEAVTGSTVTVKYEGRFENGQIFDASSRHPETEAGFTFKLGAGSVIQGWDQGVVGMKVGGKRTLVIPPNLGYGSNDYGSIPGGSTLIFDVELVEVR